MDGGLAAGAPRGAGGAAGALGAEALLQVLAVLVAGPALLRGRVESWGVQCTLVEG
jgi:hypothetical protein